MFFKYMPDFLNIDTLAAQSCTIQTVAFNNPTVTGSKLVIPHPTTGKPCLRYHEPWPATKTKYDSILVTLENHDEDTGRQLFETIDSVLYDRRVAYYHVWEKGDMLISDNILNLHTRTNFEGKADRELWRIHLD